MNDSSGSSVDLNYQFTFKKVMRDLLIVCVLGILIALLLRLADEGRDFLSYLIMSQAFGLATCLMMIFSLWLFKPRQWMSLFAVILAAVGCGVLIGMQTGRWILESLHLSGPAWPAKEIVRTVLLALFLCAAGTYFCITRKRLRLRGESLEKERIRRAEVEKEALEAKFRILQAQIEPHFLFNTLSNVVSLIDTDPARGKAMLLDLTRYLRTSLARTMPDKTTLNQEMQMISAYLNIQKIRMGERLSFSFDIPEDTGQLPLPPMLLQPLVENAVKHGLEPKIDGGKIDIRASRDRGMLKIDVTDTGLGLSSFNPGGVGLRNVRERIELLYGDQGRFTLLENAPTGIQATIEVPIHD